MAVITPASVNVTAVSGPGGTILGTTDEVIAALYRESRVHTLLLAQIVTFLSAMVGPANPINSWSPVDPTSELDGWRNDADSNFT